MCHYLGSAHLSVPPSLGRPPDFPPSHYIGRHSVHPTFSRPRCRNLIEGSADHLYSPPLLLILQVTHGFQVRPSDHSSQSVQRKLTYRLWILLRYYFDKECCDKKCQIVETESGNGARFRRRFCLEMTTACKALATRICSEIINTD